MKRILLAVGEAATASNVARQIRPWLRERETSVTLITVVESTSLSLPPEAKQALEQAEAVFSEAAEQPGIVVRVGSDPATELCREASRGGYDLLALGLCDHPRADRVVGETCAGVLHAGSLPIWVTPPTLHDEMSSQVLIVSSGEQLAAPAMEPLMGWLMAQCQVQRLGVILYTPLSAERVSSEALFWQAGVPHQTVVYRALAAEDIVALARERRVRWIGVPASSEPCASELSPLARTVLSSASCPVLLLPAPCER